MPQAIADPEELLNFAQAIMQFNETLQQAADQLGGQFTALGDTWQDEKRRQFEDNFNTLQQNLSHFRDVSAEQIPHLQHMAARLQDYLSS
jgi:uncharacterized protein YukE